MREAKAIPMINQLLKKGANVTVYDPIALPTAKAIFKNKIHYAASTIEILKNADCCILVTEWNKFKKTHARKLHQKHETTHTHRRKKRAR